MKPPKQNQLQIIGSKKWSRDTLLTLPENFKFAWVKDWPLHHLPVAWCWELDRELNSGNEPFIVAWKKEHGNSKPVEEREPAARFLPFREVSKSYTFDIKCNYYNSSFPKTIHAIEINLRRPIKEIMDALQEEIKTIKIGTSLWSNSKPRAGGRKKPGCKDYVAWFRDLAIYRLSAAGVRSKEQMNLLPDQVVGKLSRDFANWNHKRAATKRRIAERFYVLEKYAKIVSEDGNLKESLHWYDHFIQL